MQINLSDDWMDSTLWTEDASASRNATLTLKINVLLRWQNAQTLTWQSNGRQRSQQTINWDPGSRLRFQRDLKNIVERAWTGKLWLRPDREWRTGEARPRGPASHTPSIGLRLRLGFVSSAQHMMIRCYRLPAAVPGQAAPFARSNMQAPYIGSHRRCSLRGGDTIGVLDSLDVKPKPGTGQIAAVHEFGHYIGLSHVNAVAASAGNAGPNSRLAYGTGDQRLDVMGAGMRIAGWHAYPWCRRLRRHLGQPQPGETDWHSRDPMVWETGQRGTRVLWRVTTERAEPVYVGRQAELVIPGR